MEVKGRSGRPVHEAPLMLHGEEREGGIGREGGNVGVPRPGPAPRRQDSSPKGRAASSCLLYRLGPGRRDHPP
eukprot:5020710-Alexandrium_andersonii.AAC.1